MAYKDFIDKSYVGLGNVDNKSSAQIESEVTQSTAPNLNLTIGEGGRIVNVTASAEEINVLDGADLTTDELNYVSGVTSSIQTQLNSKVSSNSSVVAGTNTKITYDAKGLVTGGTSLSAEDIPTIPVDKLSGVTSTSTELNKLHGVDTTDTEINYLHGVTSNVQTQINNTAKAPKVYVLNDVLATGWTQVGTSAEYTQVVTVDTTETIANNAKVDVLPDSSVLQLMISSKCSSLYIDNNNGVLTMHAISHYPSQTIEDLNVLITLTQTE